MDIVILTVGKCRNRAIAEGVEDYIGRLGRYSRISVKPVKAEPIYKKSDTRKIKRTESERLLKCVPQDHYVYALDRSGHSCDSGKFATGFGSVMRNKSAFSFIIGGPLGLDKSILERADRILSLSKMTFPHEMALLILCEQIYRAMTILNNEKYHK